VSKSARIDRILVGNDRPLALIAGPCALEDLETALGIARGVAEICRRHGVPYVFKASYLKDNRTSAGSYSGPGLEKGLEILREVRSAVGVPVLSDVHEREEIAPAAEALDALQIPAFLCRQTRLVRDAARAGKPLNIKKGQFMSPVDMVRAAGKAVAEGNENVLLTERGTVFGYHDLVVDMRSIEVMRRAGFPVVFDATHSLQRPGAAGGVSGGTPELVPTLARAAVAAGADALFIETHPEPAKARSDAHSMLPLSELEAVLTSVLAVARAVGRLPGETS
jgi:2-dehydro-3-deoxyphosphooctonate aldolase (KDO 8-P synthase)